MLEKEKSEILMVCLRRLKASLPGRWGGMRSEIIRMKHDKDAKKVRKRE